jgi:YVTN family beta-propeller protein
VSTARQLFRLLSGIALGGLLFGCGVDETGIDPPNDELWYPLGIAAHPDGRYVYFNNSVFDRRFNAGTLMVYDTVDARILPAATARIGLFAGDLTMGRARPADCADDSCLGPLKAYTVSRGDNALVELQIDASAADAPAHLACDRTGPSCDGNAVFRSFGEGGSFAGDPSGIALDGDGIWITHAGRGIVSRWETGVDGEFEFRCSVNLPDGATAIALHPQTGQAYVSDRFGQRVIVVQQVAPFGEPVAGVAGDPCTLQVAASITIDPDATRGSTRGLAFSADGSLLYVASSTDQSLRIYDTTVGASGPRNRLLGAVALGGQPNLVRVAGVRADEIRIGNGIDQGTVGTQLDVSGEGLVYVTLFEDDSVAVIDPELMLVVARVEVGDGPHDITFLPDASGALRGYVSLFEEHALAVLDLDPASPNRFSLLATVP